MTPIADALYRKALPAVRTTVRRHLPFAAASFPWEIVRVYGIDIEGERRRISMKGRATRQGCIPRMMCTAQPDC